MGHRLGIDVGGTFTDFLLSGDDGSLRTYKTFSTPNDLSEGVMAGISALADETGTPVADFIRETSAIVHGTTLTTNTTLTRSGARVGLITTKGIRDALEMRRGRKERIYDNKLAPVTPLVPRYLRMEVDERVDYSGAILKDVPSSDIAAAAQLFDDNDVESVVICFLNSYANRANELQARQLLEECLPGRYVTVGTDVLPQIRFYERLSSSVLDSYVGPVLQRYLTTLTTKLDGYGFDGVLLIMQSNGGVLSAERAAQSAAKTLLSGPAAGATAGAAYGASQNHLDCVTVDIGGTSCDVAFIKDGVPSVVRDGYISRYPLGLPMVDIHTVGAGGGSIAWIDGGRLLQVGPQSAGAAPGPACYGFGGTEATSTDANLLLGYLNPDYFLGGRMKLDRRAAEVAVEERVARPLDLDLLEAAAGIYHVINVTMAAAVREVSLMRGYDPRDFALVVAGGAGPIHAAMIAAELEVPVAIIPKDSSTFTATGLLMSDLKHEFTRTCYSPMATLDSARWKLLYDDMENEGRSTLHSEGVPDDDITVSYAADLRYAGQFHEVEVQVAASEVRDRDLAVVLRRFHLQHDRVYGFALPEQAVEMVNVRITCLGLTRKVQLPEQSHGQGDVTTLVKCERDVFIPSRGAYSATPVYDGDLMRHGDHLVGPAVVELPTTSIFVPDTFEASCDGYGNFRLVTLSSASTDQWRCC